MISSPAHFRYLCPPPALHPPLLTISPLVITLTIFPSRASDSASPPAGFSGTSYAVIKNKSNQHLIKKVLEQRKELGGAGGKAQKRGRWRGCCAGER